jgi:hypothetical protein
MKLFDHTSKGTSMNIPLFWRRAAFALILLNMLYALWTGGYLGFAGLDPNPLREPQRLDDQISPEAVHIKTAGAAQPVAPASATASE